MDLRGGSRIRARALYAVVQVKMRRARA